MLLAVFGISAHNVGRSSSLSGLTGAQQKSKLSLDVRQRSGQGSIYTVRLSCAHVRTRQCRAPEQRAAVCRVPIEGCSRGTPCPGVRGTGRAAGPTRDCTAPDTGPVAAEYITAKESEIGTGAAPNRCMHNSTPTWPNHPQFKPETEHFATQ